MLISKIISGEQTGVDRSAIEAALAFGFPYGRLIPKGRLARNIDMEGRVFVRSAMNLMAECGLVQKNIIRANSSKASDLGINLGH